MVLNLYQISQKSILERELPVPCLEILSFRLKISWSYHRETQLSWRSSGLFCLLFSRHNNPQVSYCKRVEALNPVISLVDIHNVDWSFSSINIRRREATLWCTTWSFSPSVTQGTSSLASALSCTSTQQAWVQRKFYQIHRNLPR